MSTTSDFNKDMKALFAKREAFLAASPGETFRAELRDPIVKGLVLVVNSKSASWVYSYRPAGMELVEASPGVFTKRRPSTRHLKLGTNETLSADEARAKAAEHKNAVIGKKDPALEAREEQKKREQTAQRASCSALLPLYKKHLASTVSRKTRRKLGERHIEAEAANLTAVFAALGIADISPDLITMDHLHDIPLKASGTASARHWHGSLRRFVQWCVQQKRVSTNVTLLVPLPPAPVSRDRWLTAAEVKKAWDGTQGLTPVFGAFVRFLLCVPARRKEAATLRWPAISLEGSVWTQSGTSTKNKEPHRFHLHYLTQGVLLERLDAERRPEETQVQALKRLTEDNALVFRSPKGSTISGFSKIMAQLHKSSDTSDWTYHDARRTFASHLGEAGQDRDVVDGILNHKASSTSAGVMGVYNRSTRWPAQVAVMTVWGKMLGGFVGVADSEQPEAGNVVAFGKGAA